MPAKIIIIPVSFFPDILSCRKILLKTAINTYPLASRIGDIESGTTFRAYKVINVHPKNRIYAVITNGFKYSCTLLAYCFAALLFSMICEHEEINTLRISMPEYKYSLFIRFYHKYNASNYNNSSN